MCCMGQGRAGLNENPGNLSDPWEVVTLADLSGDNFLRGGVRVRYKEGVRGRRGAGPPPKVSF